MCNFNTFLLCLLLLWGLQSCESHDEKWMLNPIKLSVNNIYFSPNSDSITISAEKSDWLISGVKSDGVVHLVNDSLASDSILITQDWYTVKRLDSNHITISVNQNRSEIGREFQIIVELGNYFEYINVYQKETD